MNNTTTFSDVFKDKFLQGFSLSTQNLTLPNILISLAIAFALGLLIYFIYKKTYRGVLYSHSFNISLIMLSMVTTLIIMCISSAPALSLGMVGALSIVRFRSAIKDPIDTVYMFWAVGEGLALGAGFYDVAVIAGLIVGILMIVVTSVKGRNSLPYLLILHYHETASQPVMGMVKKIPGARLMSKTVQRDGIELTLEVRLRQEETGFVDKFLRVEGVYDATLITHQGDLVS